MKRFVRRLPADTFSTQRSNDSSGRIVCLCASRVAAHAAFNGLNRSYVLCACDAYEKCRP